MVRKKQTTHGKNVLENIGSASKELVSKELMSKKRQVKKKPSVSGISFLPRIVIEPVTIEDLKEYIESQNQNYKADLTLNAFITHLRGDKKCYLITDLSNLNVGKSKAKQPFNLKNANFIGSIFNNTKFINCNLEGAKFCGMHLEDVTFKDSNLSSADFRGADLSSCEFSENYRDSVWSSQVGLRFSSTSSCIRIFADIKNNLAKKNEQQRLFHNKKLELYEVRNRTPLISRVALFLNITDNPLNYTLLYLHSPPSPLLHILFIKYSKTNITEISK